MKNRSFFLGEKNKGEDKPEERSKKRKGEGRREVCKKRTKGGCSKKEATFNSGGVFDFLLVSIVGTAFNSIGPFGCDWTCLPFLCHFNVWPLCN